MRSAYGGAVYTATGVVVAVCLWSRTAAAQTTNPYPPMSTVDAYGNVRPHYRDRRSVGLFQNDTQREALRGYQDLDRRVNRRGGFRSFALPSDYRRSRRPRSTIGAGYFQPFGSLSASQRRAFAQYGGFGRRVGSRDPDDISTIFARRQALIAATALNAPLHRAFLDTGAGFGIRSTLQPQRAGIVQQEETKTATPASSLDQWLRTEVDRLHERVREEARRWFREGHYRRAARVFETITVLEPSDAESRIGQIFCYLLMGQLRTAQAVFGQLNRRDDNLFLHKLNLTYPELASGAHARQLRIQAQLRAGIRGANPDFRALHILVLWYLGKQDEAIQAAIMLDRDSPGLPYADWAAKMQVAKNRLASEP